MNRRIFSKLLKPVAVMGTVLSAGAVLIMPAIAQTESQVETSQEIELSPEAFEILCERSPLNSRCEGGATEARDSGPTDRIEERIEPNADPNADPADAVRDPSEAPVNPASEGMSSPSSPSYEMQQSPDAPMAPEEGTVAPKQAGEAPTAPDATAPDAAAPAAPSMETTAPETSAPAASISEEELQQFAEAVPQLQAIERTTQQEVVQTIEDSGFSRERFGQLYQQQTSGSAIEPAPTAEEQETFTQAYSSIQKIQQDAQSEREQIIEAQGLEPQRFDQILAAVLQDPALQQQVQGMMAQ
jgi:Domain of unknown function (DUF4168)